MCINHFSISQVDGKLQELKRLLHSRITDVQRLKIKLIIGWSSIRKGEYQEALQYIEEVVDTQDGFDSDEETMLALLILGKIHLDLGNATKVSKIIEKIKKFDKSDQLYFKTALTHIEVLLEVNKGEYDLSLVLLRQLLHQLKTHGNNIEIAKVMMRIGLVYIYKGENEEALEYFKHCRQVFRETGIKRYEGFSLNNIAGLHEVKGEFEKALQYYERTKTILGEISDKRSIARVYHNIANCYAKIEEYSRAEQYFHESLKLKKELTNSLDLAKTYTGLGVLQLKIDKIQKAQENLENAKKLYREAGNTHFVMMAMEPLFEIYRQTKQSRKIALNLDLVQKYLDSDNRMTKMIARLIYSIHHLENDSEIKQAVTYLKDIVNDEIIRFGLYIKAIIQLLKHYITETTPTYITEEESSRLLQELEELAEKSKSNTLKLEILLLKTKFHLLHNRIHKAKATFNEIKNIAHVAHAKNDPKILEKIRNIKEYFEQNKHNKDTQINPDDFRKSLNKLYAISSQLEGVAKDTSTKVKIDPKDIGAAFFKIGDEGPTVLEYDLTPIEKPISDEGQFLQKLSMTLAVVIGQGQEYHQGVYDLPPVNLNDYRLLLVAFKMADPTAADPRLNKTGYFQFGLFIPKPLHSQLPSSSKLESTIDLGENDFDIYNINKKTLFDLRDKLCYQISRT